MRSLLLAEDDAQARTLLGAMLESLFPSAQVVVAEDGDQALDLLDDAVACVVSDVDMPALDGFRLCWAIRNSPLYRPWRSVPVILFSAYVHDDRAVQAAWDAGTALLLPKPFAPLELARMVSRSTRLEPVMPAPRGSSRPLLGALRSH